jgi:aspartate oxidase
VKKFTLTKNAVKDFDFQSHNHEFLNVYKERKQLENYKEKLNLLEGIDVDEPTKESMRRKNAYVVTKEIIEHVLEQSENIGAHFLLEES